MPRDGLARRFGLQLLLALDQALGKVADVRQTFAPPSRFASRLLLPAPASNCEALLFGTHRLLLELAGFLQARAAGIQELHVQLLHPKGAPTPVTRITSYNVCYTKLLRYLCFRQLRAPWWRYSSFLI